jgi:hypothetical protein
MLIEVTRPPIEFVTGMSNHGELYVFYVWRRHKAAAPTYVAVGTVMKLKTFYRAVRAEYFDDVFSRRRKQQAACVQMLVCEAAYDLRADLESLRYSSDFWWSANEIHLFFGGKLQPVDVAEYCKSYRWGS